MNLSHCHAPRSQEQPICAQINLHRRPRKRSWRPKIWPKNSTTPRWTRNISCASLIQQEGGVVTAVIARIGADPDQIIHSVDRALAAKSRTSGGGLQIGMSRESTALLEEAQAIRPSSAEADRRTRDRQKPTNPREGTVSQIRDGSGAAV